jgi:hypothetical protein
VPHFRADVEFHFSSDNLEATSADIRRLLKAAEDVGFDLKRVRVAPAPPDEDEGDWMSYGPLDRPAD